LSNDEIHRYTREVRAVVAKLRESLLETNEEIKSITRGKESLEKALDHTRKDIRLNKDSQDVRMSRPPKEKVKNTWVQFEMCVCSRKMLFIKNIHLSWSFFSVQ